MNSNSLSGAREARLDRAIDRAVREMMQVDPPAGLRRRVVSRLNAPVERRVWLLPQYVFASAALVVLAVALTFVRQEVRPPAAPASPDIFASYVPRVPDPAAPPNTPDAQVSISIPSRPSSSGITRERIRMPPVTNVFGAPTPTVAATVDRSTDAVPARPARIDVDSLVPLTIVPLSARPIRIPPLVIDSLVVPGPPKGKP